MQSELYEHIWKENPINYQLINSKCPFLVVIDCCYWVIICWVMENFLFLRPLLNCLAIFFPIYYFVTDIYYPVEGQFRVSCFPFMYVQTCHINFVLGSVLYDQLKSIRGSYTVSLKLFNFNVSCKRCIILE